MNKESRNSILETLDYNLSTSTLSEQTGIEKRHITEYRKTHSKGRATVYSPHRKPRKMRIDPKSIDWRKGVAEIATEAGVSKQRIYQIRRRLVEGMMAADEEKAILDTLERLNTPERKRRAEIRAEIRTGAEPDEAIAAVAEVHQVWREGPDVAVAAP